MSLRCVLATFVCGLAMWVAFLGSLFAIDAFGNCQTHKCWQRVHVKHLERMVERRIERVAPLRCYGQPSAVPCWIITRESRGDWSAWNAQSCGTSGYHARGFYQLCGHGEPWPVLLSSRYETLKRKLAHRRIAAHLWNQQQAGQARHW